MSLLGKWENTDDMILWLLIDVECHRDWMFPRSDSGLDILVSSSPSSDKPRYCLKRRSLKSLINANLTDSDAFVLSSANNTPISEESLCPTKERSFTFALPIWREVFVSYYCASQCTKKQRQELTILTYHCHLIINYEHFRVHKDFTYIPSPRAWFTYWPTEARKHTDSKSEADFPSQPGLALLIRSCISVIKLFSFCLYCCHAVFPSCNNVSRVKWLTIVM